jgi:hypothetical protein
MSDVAYYATDVNATTLPFSLPAGEFNITISATAWNSGSATLNELQSNGSYAQAQAAVMTDLTNVETANTALGTIVATAVTDAATAVTDATTANTDVATAITDFTAAVGTASGDSLIELLNNQTWTAATLQLSGTPGAGGVSLTQAQQEGLITLINAVGTALVAAKAATVASLAAATQANTDVGTVSTDSGTLSSDLTQLEADVNVFGTTAWTANEQSLVALGAGVYELVVVGATGITIAVTQID